MKKTKENNLLIIVMTIVLSLSFSGCDEFYTPDDLDNEQQIVFWDEEIHEPNKLDVEIYGLSPEFIPWAGYEFEMTKNEKGENNEKNNLFTLDSVNYDVDID